MELVFEFAVGSGTRLKGPGDIWLNADRPRLVIEAYVGHDKGSTEWFYFYPIGSELVIIHFASLMGTEISLHS